MRVLMWIGNAPNEKALANKVFQSFNLVGVVIENKNSHRPKYTFKSLFQKLLEKMLFYTIDGAWINLMKYYQLVYPSYPSVTALHTENINKEEVLHFSKNLKPDIIMVSGTRLVKAKMFNASPSLGFINLHTGLSPYVKGGPNCTNWCLSNNEFHLIGNTIMWLDAGIDTGNIITTDFVQFSGKEDLNEIHFKVMESAHNLYLEALEALSKTPEQCLSVKQSEIAEGKTYFNKQWNFNARKNLLQNIKGKNFFKTITSEEFKKNRAEIKLIKLPA